MTTMLKTTFLGAIASLLLGSTPLLAAGTQHIEDHDFSFEGPFGAFDQHQLQRGLQVYQEVCSACHGIRQVYFRNLSDEGGPGLSEDQMKAFTKLYTVVDKDTGEERPATPADHFPPNTAANAPDLSLMAKARAGFHGPYGLGISQFVNGTGGPEYIFSLMNGYTGEEKEEAGETYYENHAFPGGWIKMPPPLSDDAVTYRDGHSADIHHMAADVSAFLMWTAEPKMMARKEAGMTSVLFLAGLAVLLYLTNKKLWAPIKRKS